MFCVALLMGRPPRLGVPDFLEEGHARITNDLLVALQTLLNTQYSWDRAHGLPRYENAGSLKADAVVLCEAARCAGPASTEGAPKTARLPMPMRSSTGLISSQLNCGRHRTPHRTTIVMSSCKAAERLRPLQKLSPVTTSAIANGQRETCDLPQRWMTTNSGHSRLRQHGSP